MEQPSKNNVTLLGAPQTSELKSPVWLHFVEYKEDDVHGQPCGKILLSIAVEAGSIVDLRHYSYSVVRVSERPRARDIYVSHEDKHAP